VIAAALAAVLATGPLGVSAPAAVRRDGRTASTVKLMGGPELLEGEDPTLPDLGSISCRGASVVAANGTLPPRVLPPAGSEPGEISCVARRRGEESAFSLRLEAPGAGLYASLLQNRPAEVALHPFRIPQAKLLSLHAAASAGRLIESPDGTLRIALPPGRSPRALAVALLDGDGEGAAFLPLPGHTRLRLESKRRSVLSVRVAGALFGPVRAPKGKATLPVFVPPGTQSGVVRAVDRIGNVREVAIDLETPSLPRIAAVASGNQVVARGELRLAFALAAADGAPAENAQVRAAASRGSVEAPAARGAGLWTARYRAPASPGSDLVTIDVKGDPSAGTVKLRFEVVAGPPAEISLDLPSSAPRAGDELVVHAGVRDAAGNALAGVPLEASLAGAPARISWRGKTVDVRGLVPERLPAGGAVEISLRSGDAARAQARIEARPGEASTAELRADPTERTALLRVLVRDRFGNLLGASGFALAASGASVGPLRAAAAGAAEADLDAAPRVRAAEASVIAGGRVLARTSIAFDPPPEAWLLSARGQGGGMSSGAMRAPRLGAALGIRRRFGSFEGGALLGLDALSYRDTIVVDLAGAQHPLSRHLFALTVPLLLRARLPIARRFGASLEAGPAAVFAWTSASSEVSGNERVVSVRPGFRAGASLDFSLGRGRIGLGASVGSARLTNGAVVGQIEGTSVWLGYEAWWLDIGP